MRRLLAWWEQARGDRAMPSRTDFDPARLRDLLPDLILVGVAPGRAPGEHVFQYRLTGTEIDAALGINLTGTTLDAAPFGCETETIRQQYETVVTESRPLICAHKLTVASRRYVEYQRLAVPLAAPDGSVAALLCLVDFKCAFTAERGRPADCPGPARCWLPCLDGRSRGVRPQFLD